MAQPAGPAIESATPKNDPWGSQWTSPTPGGPNQCSEVISRPFADISTTAGDLGAHDESQSESHDESLLRVSLVASISNLELPLGFGSLRVFR